MGLRGMYQEAIANTTADLEMVLQSYERILQDDPMNVVCRYQPDRHSTSADLSRQY